MQVLTYPIESATHHNYLEAQAAPGSQEQRQVEALLLKISEPIKQNNGWQYLRPIQPLYADPSCSTYIGNLKLTFNTSIKTKEKNIFFICVYLCASVVNCFIRVNPPDPRISAFYFQPHYPVITAGSSSQRVV